MIQRITLLIISEPAFLVSFPSLRMHENSGANSLCLLITPDSAPLQRKKQEKDDHLFRMAEIPRRLTITKAMRRDESNHNAVQLGPL